MTRCFQTEATISPLFILPVIKTGKVEMITDVKIGKVFHGNVSWSKKTNLKTNKPDCWGLRITTTIVDRKME
jgi:hypothetical protein